MTEQEYSVKWVRYLTEDVGGHLQCTCGWWQPLVSRPTGEIRHYIDLTRHEHLEQSGAVDVPAAAP